MATISKNLTRLAVGLVVLVVVAGGVYFAFFNGPADKTVKATFPEAIGIYAGTPVRILGVQVGEVQAVKPESDGVQVTMSYDPSYQLPANVSAVEVANSLVSDRYLELTPAYTGGKVLPSGHSVMKGHTGGPAELDDIYASLNKLSVALGPNGANKGGQSSGALSTLLKVSAANLKGNGAALGNSITQLSAAAQTLAGSRGDLFAVVSNLRKFTGALKASDSQVRLFNQQLAQVTGDLSSERTDLGAALHDLGIVLNQVNTFIKNNRSKLHTTLSGLASVTGILVNQKSSLEETLAVAPVALANVVHLYEPRVGALRTRGNMSSLTNPVQLCTVLKGGGLLSGTLLGPLTTQIGSLCTTLTKGLNIPSGGVDLTGLLGGIVPTGTGGAGGAVGTGGGSLPGQLPGFPLGGSTP